MNTVQKSVMVVFLLGMVSVFFACDCFNFTRDKADPYFWGAGVGVTDLDAAVAFYTEFFDMKVESTASREDRDETVLWAEADRGSRIILMKYKDGRDTQRINGKFVFAVANVDEFYTTLIDAGCKKIFAPLEYAGMRVAQVFGPEDFLIEIEEVDTDKSYLISLGFGVSDLSVSEAFYTNALNMEKTIEFPMGTLNEVVMEYPTKGGAGIVLQNYTVDGYKYKDNPIKLVHHVPNPSAVIERIIKNGGSVVKQIGKLEELDDAIGVIAKDPDGYLLEIIEDKKGSERSVEVDHGCGGDNTGNDDPFENESQSLICGGKECTTPAGSSLNACCVEEDQSCGLGYGGECLPMNMPGTEDERCPAYTFQALGAELKGCCKPDNKCGVMFTSGLGCVERTEVPGYLGGPLDSLDCDTAQAAGF